MIKYFKKRREKEIKEIFIELLKQKVIRRKLEHAEKMEGKTTYVIDIENVNTTTDLIKVIDILSDKITFVLTDEEASKTDKYLKKKNK